MTVERKGRGKNRRVFLNGIEVCPVTLEAVFKRYFTEEGWGRLKRDLEKYGKVHAALVFVDNDLRCQDKLEEANKKIAELERRLRGDEKYASCFNGL